MCNLFTTKSTAPDIARQLQAFLPFVFDWKEPIVPRGVAPVLMLGEGRELVPMQFGGDDPKYPGNNARVEKLDKWPWKDAAKSRRCIVPLSRFREPCYWGEPAGKEVEFYSPGDDYLGVAALYGKLPHEPGLWMTLVMRPACQFVMDRGHHRQPFFLRPEAYDAWLARESDPAAVLRQHFYEPPLAYEVVRQMAPAWTSRRKSREKDRDDQLAAIEETGLRLGI